MKLTINNIEIETQHYVDKWVKLALEATPSTDEEIIKNLKTLYRKANIQEPKEVIVYRDYEKFLKHDWKSLRVS